MAGWLGVFGVTAGFMFGVSLVFTWQPWWRSVAERALQYRSVFIATISIASTAAVISVTFVAGTLIEAPSAQAILQGQGLDEPLALTLLLLFAAVSGLGLVLLGAVALEINPTEWPRLQRRLRSATGGTLVLGAAAAIVLPVAVMHLVLSTVDAARSATAG